MPDFFKLAELELEKVSYSSYESSNKIDQVRIAKAEVYAKLAHSQVLREIHDNA